MIKKIINSSGKKIVIPKIPIHDALKENISDDIVLNLPRENFFSTQTPQSFKFKEILNLHIKNKSLYKDDDSIFNSAIKKCKIYRW